jgi:methylglyoxal reductase
VDHPKHALELRPLGRSGLDIPPITFGAMSHGLGRHSTADRIRTLQSAIDAGVTAIDTAPLYDFGDSEEVVGRAIQGRRATVQVLTKVGLRWDDADGWGELLFRAQRPDGGMREVRRNSRPESIRWEVEQSLLRLKVDVLDLVQVHHRDRETPIPETMGALSDLHREGKIRAIGVSNFEPRDVEESSKALGDLPLASVQSHYNLIHRVVEPELLPTMRAKDIGMLCYSPLQESLLTGRVLPAGDPRSGNWAFHPKNARLIGQALDEVARPLAERYSTGLAQIAIAWLLAQPGVASVIVGASSSEQAEQNAAAADIHLTQNEAAELGNAFASLPLDRHAGPDPLRRAVRRVRIRLGHLRRRILGQV